MVARESRNNFLPILITLDGKYRWEMKSRKIIRLLGEDKSRAHARPTR